MWGMLLARLAVVAFVCALGLYSLELMKQAIRVAEKPLLVTEAQPVGAGHAADFQRCLSFHTPRSKYDYQVNPNAYNDRGIS